MKDQFEQKMKANLDAEQYHCFLEAFQERPSYKNQFPFVRNQRLRSAIKKESEQKEYKLQFIKSAFLQIALHLNLKHLDDIGSMNPIFITKKYQFSMFSKPRKTEDILLMYNKIFVLKEKQINQSVRLFIKLQNLFFLKQSYRQNTDNNEKYTNLYQSTLLNCSADLCDSKEIVSHSSFFNNDKYFQVLNSSIFQSLQGERKNVNTIFIVEGLQTRYHLSLMKECPCSKNQKRCSSCRDKNEWYKNLEEIRKLALA